MKTALLCVSFGTSVPSARESITAVENALREEAPQADFFRAFTSPTIRRLLLRGGLGGRGLTLGAFQQVGAGAFRRGEHLLRVGAQRGVARPLSGGLAAFLL